MTHKQPGFCFLFSGRAKEAHIASKPVGEISTILEDDSLINKSTVSNPAETTLVQEPPQLAAAAALTDQLPLEVPPIPPAAQEDQSRLINPYEDDGPLSIAPMSVGPCSVGPPSVEPPSVEQIVSRNVIQSHTISTLHTRTGYTYPHIAGVGCAPEPLHLPHHSLSNFFLVL